MKKLIPLLLILCGCATVPVERHFPTAPDVLLEPCEKLKTIDTQQVKFSDFLKIVTLNYTEYHKCAAKVQTWQDWYKAQKENFDSVK